MELDEAGTVSAWRRARAEVIDPTIEHHHGRIVKLTGDGFLAEFSTVESAVRAALSMQHMFAAMFAVLPVDRRVAFRMGVDIGDIWVDAQDVYGNGVNIAARLESLAKPGELCVSDAVHAAIKHKIAARYSDLGPQRVKNVATPVRAWRVSEATHATSTAVRHRPKRWQVELAVGAVLVGVAAIALYSSWISIGAFVEDRDVGPRQTSGAIEPAILVDPNIDSETGFHMVSRSFDHPIEEFFAVQDEVTSLTVANLRVALPSATQARSEGSAATSLDAYVLYRRGMDALYKPVTPATISEALAAFQGSLAVDMDYAAAHAGICLTYASGYRVVNDASYIDSAERSCAVALGLNPNLDVVHNALGELHTERGDYDAAETDFKRAVAINPNSVSGLIGLGKVYGRRQRPTEAEDVLKQAVTLQPGSWDAYNAYGGFLFNNGRYREAARQYREIVSMDARNLAGWNNLGASLTLSGQFAEALIAYQRSIAVEPTQTAYANLGILHYYLGQIDDAVAALERAAAITPNDYMSWSNLGDVLSFSATPEKARQAFARAEQLAEERRQINRRDADTTIDLAWIKAMLDRFDEAAALTAAALEIAPTDPRVQYVSALVLARRGDAAAAIASLETAVEMGYPVALIAAEPHLESLRDERKYRELIGGRIQ